MILGNINKFLYPDIFDWQFAVGSDADGENPYIAYWDSPHVQPMSEQMDAALDASTTYWHLKDLQTAAQQALTDSNQQIFAFLEQASTAVPDTWKTYRQALRDILTQTQGDVNQQLPPEPAQ